MEEFHDSKTSSSSSSSDCFIMPNQKINLNRAIIIHQQQVQPQNQQHHLLELPNELINLIFKYLSYDQISKMRRVCKRFNKVCSDMLNIEFNRLRNFTQQLFYSVKSQMPRRESARRKHILAKEYDIIEALNMRLTLLQMTFSKHIKRKHCCFFPGEIIDEIHRILNNIKLNRKQRTSSLIDRAYKVTDELFDLSTMAMEYFKEYIEPKFPEMNYSILDYESFPNLPSTTYINKCITDDDDEFDHINFHCNVNDNNTNSNNCKVEMIHKNSHQEGTGSNRCRFNLNGDDSNGCRYCDEIFNTNPNVFKNNQQQKQQKEGKEQLEDGEEKSLLENSNSYDTFVKNTTEKLKKLEKSLSKNNLSGQSMKAAIESHKQKFNENHKKFQKQQTHLDEMDRKYDELNQKLLKVIDEMNQMKEQLKSNSKLTEASTQTSQDLWNDTVPRKRIKTNKY